MIDVEFDMRPWTRFVDRMEQIDLDPLAREAAEVVREEWLAVAQARLNTSRDQYMEAIQPVESIGGGRYVIELKGKLADMIERGAPEYDMRQSLLAGRDRRVIPLGVGGAVRWRTVGEKATRTADVGRGAKRRKTRRKSTHAEPWVHPGFEAHNFRVIANDQARARLEELTAAYVQAQLRAAAEGTT